MLNEIEEKELKLTDILFRSWSIYLQFFKEISIIVLSILLPVCIFIYSLFMLGIEYNGIFRIVINLLLGLSYLIITMSIALFIESVIQNKDNRLNSGMAIKISLSKIVKGSVTELLGLLIIFGMSLLLIIPGIIWAVYYAFRGNVVVLRNISGKKALDYSKTLAKGNWWKIFGYFIINAIIGLFILYILSMAEVISSIYIFIVLFTLLVVSVGYYNTSLSVLFLNLDYIKNKVNKI